MARAQNGATKRAADLVYERIKEEIAAGVYRPGVHLGEATLAERYAVSRTPVRAALARLESDGFIVIAPHTGAVVTKRTLAEVNEVFEVRAILESEAAGLAARRRSDGHVEALARIADAMEEIAGLDRDVGRLSALNKEFHQTILDAAGNPTLRQSAERLMALGFLVHTYTRFTNRDIARSLTDHRNVLAAIESRDPSWANAAMRSHILGASNVLRARLSEDEAGDRAAVQAGARRRRTDRPAARAVRRRDKNPAEDAVTPGRNTR